MVALLNAKTSALSKKQDETNILAQKAVYQSGENSKMLAKNTALTETIAKTTDGLHELGISDALKRGYIAGQISRNLGLMDTDKDKDELASLEKALHPKEEHK